MNYKTARIDDVLNERIWDGPHGRVFYYTLVLDNGERGEIGTKTQDSYHSGDQLHYTAEHTERGWKFKRINPDQQQDGGDNNNAARSQGNGTPQQAAQRQTFGGGGRGSNASFAMSYAKDFMIAANVAILRGGTDG